MRPGRTVTSLALLLSGFPSSLVGQTPSLQPGSRLRLTVPCDVAQSGITGERRWCRAEGSLLRVQADSLVLAAGPAATSHRLGDIGRVEISRGVRSHRWIGAGAGFVLGAGVTFAVLHTGGSNSLCDRSRNQDAINSSECLGLAALGGLAGAGVGMIVGGLIRTERWEEVAPEWIRITVGPMPGRPGLGVTMVF